MSRRARARAQRDSDDFSGQISASLTALSRTVDEYDALARREPVAAKQEKARERVKNFRAEMMDYREHFERLKREREQQQQQHVRGSSPVEKGPADDENAAGGMNG